MNFFNFFYVLENGFYLKNQDLNRGTVRLIIRKIFEGDVKSWHKNISKVRNVTFIFQNFIF